jgi:hypothetical protein
MGFDMSLLDGAVITKGAAAATAATSTIDGAQVDMQGFDGVVIVASVATANAGNILKAQGSDASGSGQTDLVGATAVAGSDGDVVAIDVYRPTQRYINAALVRGASTVTGEIRMIRYRASKVPAQQASSGVVVTKIASPQPA